MAGEPTLEHIESPEDYDFHKEGILLISENGTCFGNDLKNIATDVISGIPGYDEYLDFSPHSDGYELLTDATKEDKILALANSVWLVEASCFFEEETDTVLRPLIELSVPVQAWVVVWYDSNSSSYPEAKVDRFASFSVKIRLVKSEQDLRDTIKDYFQLTCDPRHSRQCVEWNNEARKAQMKIV